MSRSTLVLAAAVVLLPAASPGAPVPKHLLPPDTPFDFPTEVGTGWCYRSGARCYEVMVTKSEERGGARVLSLVLFVGGCGQPAGTVSVSPKSVSVAGPVAPAFPVRLVLPLRPGVTWEDGGRALAVAGVEPVDVPAGRYDAIRVDESARPGGAVTATYWYASGVGLVKRVSKGSEPGQEHTVVLEAFAPGKK